MLISLAMRIADISLLIDFCNNYRTYKFMLTSTSIFFSIITSRTVFNLFKSLISRCKLYITIFIFDTIGLSISLTKGVFVWLLAMASAAIAFLLLKLRSTNIIGWLPHGGKVSVTCGHLTSRKQVFFPKTKRSKEREPKSKVVCLLK